MVAATGSRAGPLTGLRLMTADLPGDPGQAQAVAPVRGQIDLDAGVVQAQPVAEVAADLRVRRQGQDALGGFSQTQLRGRADHPQGLDAAELGPLDLEPTRELRPHQGDRDLHPRRHIGRPADDLKLRALPRVHLADAELLGVRVTLAAHHQPDHHTGEGGCGGLHGVYLKPRHGQLGRQGLGVYGRGDPLAQPCLTESHRPAS